MKKYYFYLEKARSERQYNESIIATTTTIAGLIFQYRKELDFLLKISKNYYDYLNREDKKNDENFIEFLKKKDDENQIDKNMQEILNKIFSIKEERLEVILGKLFDFTVSNLPYKNKIEPYKKQIIDLILNLSKKEIKKINLGTIDDAQKFVGNNLESLKEITGNVVEKAKEIKDKTSQKTTEIYDNAVEKTKNASKKFLKYFKKNENS